MTHYIEARIQLVASFIVHRPIFDLCEGSERMRETVPRQCWDLIPPAQCWWMSVKNHSYYNTTGPLHSPLQTLGICLINNGQY